MSSAEEAITKESVNILLWIIVGAAVIIGIIAVMVLTRKTIP